MDGVLKTGSVEAEAGSHDSAPGTGSVGDVLNLIRRAGGLSRADIIDKTRLSRSTVAARLDTLQAAGVGPVEIARRLGVSRMTVWRKLKEAAA
mgnify:CR=1 FL=1